MTEATPTQTPPVHPKSSSDSHSSRNCGNSDSSDMLDTHRNDGAAKGAKNLQRKDWVSLSPSTTFVQTSFHVDGDSLGALTLTLATSNTETCSSSLCALAARLRFMSGGLCDALCDWNLVCVKRVSFHQMDVERRMRRLVRWPKPTSSRLSSQHRCLCAIQMNPVSRGRLNPQQPSKV